MRRLFPDPGEVDPIDAYGRLSRDGQRPRVRLNMIASVDGVGSLDGHSAALGGPADKALFASLRASAAVDDRARAAEVADVIMAGDNGVDLVRALRALGERGHENVLAEGGPGIAAQLAGADLLDELCLAVSPLLAGGDAKRILDGGFLKPPAGLELHHVLEYDGYLFLRYLRQ